MSEEAKFGRESDPLVGSKSSTYTSTRYGGRSKNRTLYILIGIIVVAVLALLILAIGIGVGVTNNRTDIVELYDAIQIEKLMGHLEDWQEIAERHDNSRSVMTGYEETALLVMKRLQDAGYQNLTKQDFKVATYTDDGDHTLSATGQVNGQPSTVDFQLGQFSVMRYSGATNGVVSGPLVDTDCGLSQFPQGGIALVDYDACEDLFEVAKTAKDLQAAALIFSRDMDSENRDIPPNTRIFKQTVDDFEVVDLPMLGLNYPARSVLNLFDETITISVQVNMRVYMQETFNVLCYTDRGKADSIIVVGSHLDSVPAGPGINDNGSGSSANLEMALQLISSGTTPENQILFAFWGAEEWGLFGSNHYVMDLPEEARSKIALNLNFDMIGSPNYIRGIYNGSGAENEKVRAPSTVIQELFVERFESLDLAHQFVPFNGRSDYGPFIAVGVDIPAGGLFTGAEALKTVDEQEKYGGLANAPLDPCYHKFCDTIKNVNEDVFLQTSQAAAYVLNKLMLQVDLRAFLSREEYDYYEDDSDY